MIYTWPKRVHFRTYLGWSDREPTKADIARRKAVDEFIEMEGHWPTPTADEMLEIQERNL